MAKNNNSAKLDELQVALLNDRKIEVNLDFKGFSGETKEMLSIPS